jgi:hypothetical protein
MIIQSALINVKTHLSHKGKMGPDKLKKIVNEACEIVMKKIDSLQQLFIFKFGRSF